MSPLTEELRRLWRQAGRPTMRTIEERAHRQVSRTTINRILNGHGVKPRWEAVQAIGRALNGDLTQLLKLYEEHDETRNELFEPEPRRLNTPMALLEVAHAIRDLAEAVREHRAGT